MYGIEPRLRGELKVKKTSIPSARRTPMKTMNTMLHITEEEYDDETIGEKSHYLVLDINKNVKKPVLQVNTQSKNANQRGVSRRNSFMQSPDSDTNSPGLKEKDDLFSGTMRQLTNEGIEQTKAAPVHLS